MIFLKIYIKDREISCNDVASLKAAKKIANETPFPDDHKLVFANIHKRGDEIYENTITLKNPI